MSGGKKVYLNRPSFNKPLIDVPAAPAPAAAPKAQAPTTSGRATGIGPGKTAVQPGKTWDEVAVEMYPELAGAELRRVNGRIFAGKTEVPGASLKTSHYSADAPKRSDIQAAVERARPTAEPIVPGLRGQPPEGPSKSTEYPDMESKRVAGANILAAQRGDTRPASERQPGGGPAMISPEEVKRVNPEHPSQLPPEQLGAKTGEEPRDIEAQRSQLRSLRRLFDLSILQGGFRPEGQPPSFTPEGESPKPGQRANGNKASGGRGKFEMEPMIPESVEHYVNYLDEARGDGFTKKTRRRGGAKAAKAPQVPEQKPYVPMSANSSPKSALGVEDKAFLDDTNAGERNMNARARGVAAAQRYLEAHPTKKGLIASILKVMGR